MVLHRCIWKLLSVIQTVRSCSDFTAKSEAWELDELGIRRCQIFVALTLCVFVVSLRVRAGLEIKHIWYIRVQDLWLCVEQSVVVETIGKRNEMR